MYNSQNFERFVVDETDNKDLSIDNMIFQVQNPSDNFENGLQLNYINYMMLYRKIIDGVVVIKGYIQWKQGMSNNEIKCAMGSIEDDMLSFEQTDMDPDDIYKIMNSMSVWIKIYGTKREVESTDKLRPIYTQIQLQIDNGDTRDTFIQDMPFLFNQHYKYIDDYLDLTKRTKIRTSLINWRNKITFRSRQVELEAVVKKQDDKTITWVCDYPGGSGKTTWAKCKFIDGNTLLLSNLDKKQVANAWDPYYHTLIIFDFTREESNGNTINYRTIKEIKSGITCNEKYRCGVRVTHKNPVIIVLANALPKKDKLNDPQLIIWGTPDDIPKDDIH